MQWLVEQALVVKLEQEEARQAREAAEAAAVRDAQRRVAQALKDGRGTAA